MNREQLIDLIFLICSVIILLFSVIVLDNYFRVPGIFSGIVLTGVFGLGYYKEHIRNDKER